MAIDLITQYPTGADPVSLEWPFGEPRNIVSPGDGLGTPWEVALVKEFVGMQQALLKSGSIVPSGAPDKVTASQYLQAIIELASGRAVNYDESGVADAYVLDARTGMQGPASYFTDMEINFTPGVVNTGASTADVAGLGVQSLRDSNGVAFTGGELVITEQIKFKYDGTNFVLQTTPIAALPFQNSFTSAEQNIASVGLLTIPHGLGSIPSLVQMQLICKTAEFGYSIGDILLMPIAPDLSNHGLSAEINTTNILVRIGSNTSPIILNDANSGIGVEISNGFWKIIVKAWA